MCVCVTVRNAVEAYQPRAISDATVIKPQYIETDDEPWHSTSKQTITVNKSVLESSKTAGLPFVTAEDALGEAVRASKSEGDVKKAIATALAAGARAGSPAENAAKKVMEAFAKGGQEEADKVMPKPPKPAGAQGAGWDGMKRAIGKVHDNSVA